MFSYSYYCLLLSLISFALPAHGQVDSSNSCSAFASNGLAASNYQYYRFYDFRNIANGTTSTKKREPLEDRASTAAARSKSVSDTTWTDDWYIRDYPRKSPGSPSIPVDFIPDRVYICKETYSRPSTHYS